MMGFQLPREGHCGQDSAYLQLGIRILPFLFVSHPDPFKKN